MPDSSPAPKVLARRQEIKKEINHLDWEIAELSNQRDELIQEDLCLSEAAAKGAE